MTKRYDQLLTLIDEVKPSFIVEVGVHRALRAEAMCERALKHVKGLCYRGYDVFETKDQAFQDAAMNGKGMPTQAEAEKRLGILVKRFSRLRFRYELNVGDTRETLNGGNVKCDFAFIDGDHRVEAIQADYEALKDSPVIVFDDYYWPGGTSVTAGPDLNKFGANSVVEAIRLGGGNVKILPVADPCKHGGVIKLAVVRR